MKFSDKQIDAIFNSLLERCRKKHVYSVQEAAEEMGINYEQIIAWSKTDMRWDLKLEFLMIVCYDNAETAGFYGKIEPEKAIIYMLAAGDEDALSRCPTIESRNALIDETIKEDYKGKKLNKRQKEEKERRLKEAKLLYEKLFPQNCPTTDHLVKICHMLPNDN